MNNVRIMLTYICENNCSYCYIKNSPNYKETKCLTNKEAIIKQLVQIKDVYGYELIGGEIFDTPELTDWFLEWNKNNGNKPVTIFTSGTRNLIEMFDIFGKYDNQFFFNFSYDGKHSLRNKENSFVVKDAIKLFKTKWPAAVRWSINKEDIPYIYEHYLELLTLGMENPIFFPMKYFDYTRTEIDAFCEQFSMVLDYCVREKINILSMLTDSLYVIGSGKESFSCPNEITILPNGKITNCYVLYGSSGFDNKYLYEAPQDLKVVTYKDKTERCNRCVDIFGGCNKCPGNLIQYQRLTGHDMWHSYCDLISRLSKVFIHKKLDLQEFATIECSNNGEMHTRFVKNPDGKYEERRYKL